tara:strand:+ start:495 stop:953 length:459 start_codon:yes stop_codon:yes gene_type:complete
MATQYNPGFTDAEAVNNSPRDNFIYKDFSLFFTRNPVTSDVSTITDAQDIKRAVRNLVLLNTWDKPFHPEIGGNIRAMLFENFTPIMFSVVRNQVETTIMSYEPRVTVTNVDFEGDNEDSMDNNQLKMKIEFTLDNAPEKVETIDIMLKRIR